MLTAAGTTGGGDGSNVTIAPEYRLVSSSGAYAADGTLPTSRQWAAAVATYRAAGSTTPTGGKVMIVYEYTRSSPTPGP